MKRFFPLLILLAVLANTFPAAWADSDTGAPGITVEEEVSTVLPTATPEIKTAATTAPASAYDDPSFLNGYARVCRDGANVEGDAPTTLSEGAIVYAYDRDLNDRLAVAFDSRNGVVLGWMQSTDVCPLSEAETNALLDIQRACAINFFDAERTIPLVNVDAGNVERTVEPTASAEPEITVVATASAEPEITATPTASIEPEVTAALTVTVEPEITVAPTASIAPEITVAPTVTITPEITAAPTVSVGPEITVAPTVTITPEITVAPTVSVGPEITVAPTVSVEPALYASTASSLNAPLSANASAPIALNSADAKKMGVGGFMQLRPESLNNPAWASWNETVATVNESGVVTAVGAGSAYIVAQEGEGESAKSESWLIEVIAAPVKLACPSVLYIGYGETRKLDVDTDCPYEWLSYATSKSKYVRVDQNGNLYGARRGNAYVTVKSYNGLSATVRVYVVKAPSKVYISLPYSKMGVGESMQLGYSLPSGTASRITWEVSDETLATIDANGKITALKEGTVYVRGVAFNGKFGYASIQIKPEPTSVNVAESLILGVEQKQKLPASVNAESACSSFTFKSLNPEVVSVTESGTLAAIAQGVCEIEVTTYNHVTAKCTVTVKPAPTRIDLTDTVLYIGLGETARISASTDSSVSGFTYSTSKSKYVRVSSDGYVYGARRGNAIITVRTYNGLSASVRVYVRKAPGKVYLSIPNRTLGVGETMFMRYSLPSGTSGSVSWEISDASYATVDASGAFTALKEGTVYVRAVTYNGKYAYAPIQIKPAPTSVIVAESMTIGVGQNRVLSANVNAESACSSYTFKSLNPEIASVSEFGVITGKSEGICEIEVAAYNGVTARCTVTAKPAPTKIIVPSAVMYIGVGETVAVSAATDSEISGFTYSTSKSKYVRVDQNGNVYGARRGDAYITIRTYNGLTAAVRVYVRKAPTRVYISSPRSILGVGETVSLRYSLSSGASGSVIWEISEPEYATVNAKGQLTALKEGTVYVRAVTYNGKYDYMPIQIKPAPEWISTDFVSISMGTGEKRKIQVQLSEGSYSQLLYTSSDPSIAAVDAGGTITAVNRGTATILVETSVESVFAQISVEVWNAPAWVKLDAAKTLNVDETMQLTPEIDEDARTSWTFTSSNTNVATINAKGEVTALNRGQTILTARAYNGVSAQMALTVLDPWYPESVEIANAVEILNVGDTWSIETVVTPETAVPRLKWSSSNPNVAAIDENGKVTAVSGGFAYITCISEKNGACRTTILLCVKSGTLALTLPKRQTDVSGISENLSRIQAIKSSAFDEINELQRKGLITASDAAKRKSVLTNAFADYSFVWMTPAYQRYWKEANSENGAKDFKPGVVYYGMPYISGSYANRRYDHTKAINEGRYTDSGNGYYLLNQSRLLNGLYVGNDCSSFCNAANWGTSSSRIGDRTGDIYSSSYYKTVSLGNLRPGDLICLENRHVVFFLYYVDSAHTQIMILENGGAEAGVNTVHCSLYPLSYYSSLGYRGRRLKTLG